MAKVAAADVASCSQSMDAAPRLRAATPTARVPPRLGAWVHVQHQFRGAPRVRNRAFRPHVETFPVCKEALVAMKLAMRPGAPTSVGVLPKDAVVETDIPARLDRLPWARFHMLVVAA